MPALLNQRQERFCQLIKQGLPAIRAYPLAGYNAHESAPARLCANVRIKARIAELTRHIAMKTRVTVESITQELDDAAALARRVEQPGAVIQAVQTKAKLHGLLIDRKESGAPGDFDGLKTEAEVVDAFKAEHGEEAAKLLSLLLNKAALPAIPEPEASVAEQAKAGDTIN